MMMMIVVDTSLSRVFAFTLSSGTVFSKLCLKVPRVSADLQLYDSEFQNVSGISLKVVDAFWEILERYKSSR